jgi:hypothetical protein
LGRGRFHNFLVIDQSNSPLPIKLKIKKGKEKKV